MQSLKISRTVSAASASTIQCSLSAGSLTYPYGGLVQSGLPACPFERNTERTFFAGVLRVPFVDDVQEWCEVTVRLVCAVHSVVDGDESHISIGECDFGVVANLEVVASQSGHVLDDDRCHIAYIYLCNHALEVGSIEVGTAPSIIHEELDVAESVILRVLLQDVLLRFDLSRWFSACLQLRYNMQPALPDLLVSARGRNMTFERINMTFKQIALTFE